jgi:hypothetical protein
MSAEMVRFRYYLTEETDEQVKLAKLWIKKFIMLMDKLVKPKPIFDTTYQ